MDTPVMSALDLRFLVKELRKGLEGGRVRKIYQYEKKKLLFEFHHPEKGEQWLYVGRGAVYLTEQKPSSPSEPPSFCMFLRKHLMGKAVRNIRQVGFDRILEIQFPEHILVIELLPPGNLILCDSSYNIIMPLEFQKWKSREVKPRVPYKHPPLQVDLFKLSLDQLQHALGKSEKSLGAFLAAGLGLGPVYSKEACARAGIPESTPTGEIRLEQASLLHSALESLLREGAAMLYEDTASPFPLKSRSGGEEFPSFSQALDALFSREQQQPPPREEEERLERIIETQEKAREKFIEEQEERRDTAEDIYNHYPLISKILQGIRSAIDQGLSWDEIKQKTQSEDTEEAQAIKEIQEHEGTVTVEIDGKEFKLDFRISLEENAARYFEESKKAKRKLVTVDQVQAEKEEELETLPPPEPQESVKKKPRKKWYEKFRWFFTSDDFLVIGGKDAKQNDLVYSKYINPGDLAFHADIPGASLIVIQSVGREVTEEAKREAAEASASYSKAWSKGLGTIDIFAVRPEQISKSPPSGMAIAKGSFIITGEREWFRNTEVRLAVGVQIDRENQLIKVLSGPVLSLRKHADYFITIKPGLKKSLELARSIKNKLLMRSTPEDKSFLEPLPLEEIQVKIPSGMGEIVEYG
ncbi:MAG: NFACT family protein [Candidatus Aenigmarchaeota archaeon]|nr:NFACT family protein [Candidatus Aenigmarchaeota archaeon]